MRKIENILVLAVLIFSCQTTQNQEAAGSSEAEVEEANDWKVLFDGTSLDGWRAYNGENLPPGWAIVDDVMTFNTEQILEEDYDYKGSRDIIYGVEEFDNFELYVEWKIPAGGNSGIFYHIKEGYGGPPEVSPEYQLIDDENYASIHDLTAYNSSFGAAEPEKLQDWQATAADYAMHTTDSAMKQLNPTGEWNSTKIVFTEEKVEHWLNGKMVLSFVPWSEEWYEKRNSGKWQNAPDYGKFKTGYIGFQDHGSDLWFRNIKIKEL